MINNWTGVGRVTRDAELSFLGSGTAKLKFSICINKSFKQGGEWKNKANFFDCIVWGKYGETMHKHLTKGRLMGVIGELSHDQWTDNSGKQHNRVNVIVHSISLMAQPKNGGENSGHEPPPEGEYIGSENPPDEIPF